jgi:3-oxoacyl-[acyl-carrier protein] reductase
LLERKNAIIYSGGGAIGSAVARAFAAEGARVYLAGRTVNCVCTCARFTSPMGAPSWNATAVLVDRDAMGRR